jgi:hypothetical protein
MVGRPRPKEGRPLPALAFDIFMAQHAPVGGLVERANTVLWDQAALNLVVKERMRIALAESIGCSYCARFRTDMDGRPVLQAEQGLSEEDERKAELAARFGVAMFRGGATDDVVAEAEDALTPAELTDLVFSVGWFIGMQHVGRMMHWDESCPVAPIRQLVEAGEAA